MQRVLPRRGCFPRRQPARTADGPTPFRYGLRPPEASATGARAKRDARYRRGADRCAHIPKPSGDGKHSMTFFRDAHADASPRPRRRTVLTGRGAWFMGVVSLGAGQSLPREKAYGFREKTRASCLRAWLVFGRKAFSYGESLSAAWLPGEKHVSCHKELPRDFSESAIRTCWNARQWTNFSSVSVRAC